MKQDTTLRDFALYTLGQHFELVQKDLGPDAHLSKKGITFVTESWAIDGVGHLCIMRMKAFLGLMRMETAVVAPTGIDMPLINLDWVKAFGAETQFVELYDTQLQPWPEDCSSVFDGLLKRDADLPDASSENEHWYDAILYPCSYHKKGKGISERLSAAAHDYLVAYVDQMASAQPCDVQQKSEKVRTFAERLFAEGGPAVDQVTNLFGESVARRIVVQHMYGVEGS